MDLTAVSLRIACKRPQTFQNIEEWRYPNLFNFLDTSKMAGLMVVKIRCKARSKPWISHFTCTESNANEEEQLISSSLALKSAHVKSEV